jgi:hypothetical protein
MPGTVHTMRRGWLVPAVLLLCLHGASSAQADTLKDALKQHVREGIERSEAKAKRKQKASEKPKPPRKKSEPKVAPAEPAPPAAVPVPAEPEPQLGGAPEPAAGASATPTPVEPAPPPTPAPATQAPPPPPADVAISWNSDDQQTIEPSPVKPPGPKLPVRVLGKYLQLDLTFGGGYRGWVPQQYDVVHVDVASYATWNIDLKAKLFGFLSLRRGYIESNGVSAPSSDEASVAKTTAEFAPKAMWLLGVLGVPINKMWEPQIRYESRAFETRAVPQEPVCIVDRKMGDFDPNKCALSNKPLKIISRYETLVAGVRYNKSKGGSAVMESKASKFPPLFFGIGVMQYQKPYQLDIDGYTYSQALFDGHFRGIGAALGVDFGGGIDNYFADIDAQLGLGEVSLTDNLTVNELVPKGKSIGYLQGTASLGYKLVLIHAAPTLTFVPVVKAGGASFFLVDTSGAKGTDGSSSTSPSVNWDFLWTVQASLLVPL